MLLPIDNDPQFVKSVIDIIRGRPFEFVAFSLEAIKKPPGLAAYGFVLRPQIVFDGALARNLFIELERVDHIYIVRRICRIVNAT